MKPHQIFDFIGYRSLELSHMLQGHQIHPKESTDRYFRDDPHELKRITYPLTQRSMVLDVGGLKGEWSQRIYCRYGCKIDIFEPHPYLAEAARFHFASTQKVRVFEFGWGNKDERMTLYGDDIYASLYSNKNATPHEVLIMKASEIINKHYQTIDLLKINIEGAEYEVLPDLIANCDMTKILNIQVQFHNNREGHQRMRERIQRALAVTHRQEWNYDYLYESWTVKQ